MSDPFTLVWEEVEDEDLFFYSVYGSDQPGLDESAILIARTPGLTQDVTGHVYDYYHVTAVDFSGNEGAEARLANPSAGIVPEEDEVTEGEMVDSSEHADTSQERLSVFEDFLEQLDLDDEDEDDE